MGLFGDLLEETGLSGLLSGGEWRTLKNGKRIKLDAEGRIVAGMPSRYHGTHIRDLSKLTHEERELAGIDCNDVGHCHTCKKTFRTKDEAYVALLRANPRLDELRQSEFGDYDLAFLKWQRNGRRGPKPRTKITDGRMDSINEYYDLKGAARVASFTEAIYQTIPSTKKWADVDNRLRPLEEAAGFKLHPPEESIRLAAAKLSIEECRDDVDRRLAGLFDKAKGGRLASTEHATQVEEGAAGDADAIREQVRDEGGKFGHGLDAMCVCGARKGKHDAVKPFPCDETECPRFRKAKAPGGDVPF